MFSQEIPGCSTEFRRSGHERLDIESDLEKLPAESAIAAPAPTDARRPMNIEEVRKVASLARLSLNDDELATYGQQLTRILSYVEMLNEVDVEGVEPMPHAIDLQNVFREDQRQPSLDRQAALANAPKTDGQYFLVPQILEQKDA